MKVCCSSVTMNIYFVDENTRRVIDHDTWIMNLDEANNSGNPRWYKLYNAKKEYGLTSLLPEDWSRLIDRMKNDSAIFELYYKNYHTDSPNWPVCDEKCKNKMLCSMRSGRSYDQEDLCKELNVSKYYL